MNRSRHIIQIESVVTMSKRGLFPPVASALIVPIVLILYHPTMTTDISAASVFTPAADEVRTVQLAVALFAAR